MQWWDTISDQWIWIIAAGFFVVFVAALATYRWADGCLNNRQRLCVRCHAFDIGDSQPHRDHFKRKLVGIDLCAWISKLRSTMSDEELKTELERLRNENAALKKGASTGIRLKVSEKGAVSVYGMGRFPRPCIKSSG